MNILYWVLSVLAVIWFFIWLDKKRTKVHEHEEGWTDQSVGKVKRLWKDLPPEIEEFEECFHLTEDQNN